MKNNFLSFFPINFHIALAAPSKTYILLLNVNTNSHNNNRIDNREYETVFIIPGPNQDSNCKRTSKSFQICFVCFDFFRLFQLECEYLCLVLSNFRSEIVLDCYLGDFEFFFVTSFYCQVVHYHQLKPNFIWSINCMLLIQDLYELKMCVFLSNSSQIRRIVCIFCFWFYIAC